MGSNWRGHRCHSRSLAGEIVDIRLPYGRHQLLFNADPPAEFIECEPAEALPSEEDLKASGKCVQCGELLPVTWKGIGECQKCNE